MRCKRSLPPTRRFFPSKQQSLYVKIWTFPVKVSTFALVQNGFQEAFQKVRV